MNGIFTSGASAGTQSLRSFVSTGTGEVMRNECGFGSNFYLCCRIVVVVVVYVRYENTT